MFEKECYKLIFLEQDLISLVKVIITAIHIVSSKKFLRTSSSPHKTLPNDKYDAPKEVCGERKLFYCLLRNEAKNKFLMSGP